MHWRVLAAGYMVGFLYPFYLLLMIVNAVSQVGLLHGALVLLFGRGSWHVTWDLVDCLGAIGGVVPLGLFVNVHLMVLSHVL